MTAAFCRMHVCSWDVSQRDKGGNIEGFLLVLAGQTDAMEPKEYVHLLRSILLSDVLYMIPCKPITFLTFLDHILTSCAHDRLQQEVEASRGENGS
jgi:hypothetical protein